MSRVSLIAAVVAALSLSSIARADGLQVRLGATHASVGEPVALALTVDGPLSSPPEIDTPPNLPITPLGTSRSVQVVNGSVQQQTTYHYRLTPQAPGSYTLGSSASGAPVVLEVGPPNGSAAGSRRDSADAPSTQAPSAQAPSTPRRRAFLRARLPQRDLYVGETVPVTVRALVAAGTAGTVHRPPSFDSDAFVVEGLDSDARQGRAQRRGVPHATLTWRGRMRPLVAGEYDLEATTEATLEWLEQRPAARRASGGRARSLLDRLMGGGFGAGPFGGGPDPFAGFEDLFAGVSARPRRRRAEVTLRHRLRGVVVRELPEEGRPDDFTGAVGRFEVSRSIEGPARVGEPVTLTFRATGEGTLEGVVPRLLPETLDGARVYPASSETTRSGRNGLAIEGVYTQSFVPTRAGTLQLPALALPSFDPETGQYTVLATEPLAIEVAPGLDGTESSPSLGEVSEPPPPAHRLPTQPGAFTRTLWPDPDPAVAAASTSLLLLLLFVGILLGLRSERGRRWVSHARGRLARRRALARARRAAAAGRVDRVYTLLRDALRSQAALAWDVLPASVTLADYHHHGVEVPDAIREVFEGVDAIELGGEMPATSVEELVDDVARCWWLELPPRAPAPSQPSPLSPFQPEPSR